MSNNYHIKFNQPQPSSDDIAQHKDFDALLAAFQEQPKEKAVVRSMAARIRPLYYVGSAIAAAIIGAILIWGIPSGGGDALTTEQYFAQQELVQPPLNIEASFNTFKMDVNQGGVYEYESGSRLVVPAAAFMNDRGQLIEGEVEIFYREMHDHVDFFLAGIPMTYDSAGLVYQMESAGMVEIFAEQNGVRLEMAPGKSINVELVSTIQVPTLDVPPGYNIYKLDTAQRSWTYQDVDLIQVLEDQPQQEEGPLKEAKEQLLAELEDIENQRQQALRDLENTVPKPIAPVKPSAFDDDLPTFELNLLEGLLQDGQEELQALEDRYGDVIWQLTPNNPDYDERAFGVVWQNAELKKQSDQVYRLKLIHESRTVELFITPVLTGDDFDNAMSDYQNDMAAYQQVLKEWEAQVAEQKTSLENDSREAREAAQNRYFTKLEALTNTQEKIFEGDKLIKRKVMNRFQATDFGIWSCVKLIAPGEDGYLSASFEDQSGTSLEQKVGYLVDRSKNTVYRFYINQETAVKINPASRHLIWVVTNDQEIALAQPEDLEQIDQAKKKHTFQLKRINQKINSEAELRKYLEF